MTFIFTPDLFLNQSEIFEDNIDINHVEKVATTLDKKLEAGCNTLPYLWHWTFFSKAQPNNVLGPDGHPLRAGFPSPIPNLNRMWAGGRVNFIAPLAIKTKSIRSSKIINAVEKQGTNGKLYFITIQHEYSQNGQICIAEEQDIVYREPSAPILIGKTPAPESQWQETIHFDATRLFRYSAITYNSHRIHYDIPYTTEVEGYPGLVIHGPMLATLMLQAFTKATPDAQVKKMSYRGLRPLFAPSSVIFAGAIKESGVASLWAEQDNTLAQQAEILFE